MAINISLLGGYTYYQSNIDSKIIAAEQVVKASTSEKLLSFMSKEKEANEKTYINNQLLINQFGQLKEVVEILNKQRQVADFQDKNIKLYNKIEKSINDDILSVNNLYSANPKTRDEKIAVYLEKNGVNVAKKWEDAITTNRYIHIGNMVDLNKEIKSSVEQTEQIKKDILEQVQTRIKNGDFNLSEAQNKFSKDVIGQTKTELNNINQAKKDLEDLKNLSAQDEDGNVVKTDSNAQNIISNKDLNDAKEALNTYQNEAINQIANDRSKVEQLIAEAKQQNIQQANIQSTNTNHNQNVVINKGPSFLDYYLMYSWINAVNSVSTPTTIINNTTVHYPSGINNGNVPPRQVQGNATKKSYNYVIPKQNMYDINNRDSYLNKQLTKETNFGNSGVDRLKNNKQIEKSKINIEEIRDKIAKSKIKVENAKTVRLNEIKKIETVKKNKYESAAFSSKSSKSGYSSSSSRRSSFSRRK